ncbi:hypothetical protein [Caldanaerobacter subterraneus]|nr:hypothetical protein [Caldanaerobacter subterraneus]
MYVNIPSKKTISPVKNFNFVTVSYNKLNLQNGFKNSEIQWYRI